MSTHTLIKKTIISKPLETVFDFFSKAENLNLLTPPNVKFKIISPLPIHIKQGALIDYRIKVANIPFNWRTEISEWKPPFSFKDQQLKGPYKIWIHTHSFRAINENETEMIDKVEYLSPGGIFEPIIHHLFVKKKVEAIFEYREKVLLELFAK